MLNIPMSVYIRTMTSFYLRMITEIIFVCFHLTAMINKWPQYDCGCNILVSMEKIRQAMFEGFLASSLF